MPTLLDRRRHLHRRPTGGARPPRVKGFLPRRGNSWVSLPGETSGWFANPLITRVCSERGEVSDPNCFSPNQFAFGFLRPLGLCVKSGVWGLSLWVSLRSPCWKAHCTRIWWRSRSMDRQARSSRRRMVIAETIATHPANVTHRFHRRSGFLVGPKTTSDSPTNGTRIEGLDE